MRMKLFTPFLALAFAIVSIQYSLGQGEIPVNMYTGTPGIFINLYTLNDHDLTENISLSYNLSDLRLSGDHRYGVGWDINAGGQVSRKVRGLPDDFYAVNDPRKGWLYNNNYSGILSFPNSADYLTSTCNDEQADQAFLNSANYRVDTEPDLFSFSVGGQSGNFVFGNDGQVQLIPYQDILIVPTYKNAPTDKRIIKWTIVTNDGVVYTIDQPCGTSYAIMKSPSDDEGVNQTDLRAFERDYRYYQDTARYTSAWMLGTTQSPSGAKLTYTYEEKVTNTNGADRKAMIFDAQWQISPQNIVKLGDFTLMTENVTDTVKYVSRIDASTGQWVTLDPVNGVKVYDSLYSHTDSFKEFLFTYDGAFLTTVTESDHGHCNQMPPYRMYYSNMDGFPLPETGSLQSQDAWGYHNGRDNVKTYTEGSVPTSVPTIYVYPNEVPTDRYRLYPIPNYAGFSVTLTGNAYRLPDPNEILNGTLTRLIYPTGGESDFTFEANKYWDAKAGRDQLGGGLRIKSIVYYNGVDASPNIIKNFTYLDANGHSSGKLITRPAFAIPVWKQVVPDKGSNTGYAKLYSEFTTSTAQWRGLTMLTGWDISDQEFTAGSPVGYSQVTVARPGSGKAVFEYTVSASYDDVGWGQAIPSCSWLATVTKFARPADCTTMGIISGVEARLYPTFPNAPYDYERGLLIRKKEYNEGGSLVRSVENSYSHVFKNTSPLFVTGVAYEGFTGSEDIFLYGKYSILTNVAKRIAGETHRTYDINNPAKFTTEYVQYNYNSSLHRYPSVITRTMPDGTLYRNNMKYVQEYQTSPSSTDTQVKMMDMLKAARRNTVVIEQFNTVKLVGGTEKITDASLVRFASFNLNKPLVQSTLLFRPQDPVTSFTVSSSTVSAFTSDSRYETVSTVNEYSSKYDIPLSSTGEDRVTTTALYGFKNRLPVAQVALAPTTAVGFSDFETDNLASFTTTNVFTGTGRTGTTGIHPYATLARTVAKPSIATKYLLTFWLKNTPASTVTLTVTFKNTSGGTLTNPPPTNYTYTLTGDSYQYFVQPLDVSTLPSSFIIQIAGSIGAPGGSSPSLLPMLDDIAFYPDYASISSVTYNIPFGPSSSTDVTGLTTYTSYDPLGRVKLIRDKDNNIRKRLTYNMPGQTSPGLIASIGYTGHKWVDEEHIFSAQDNPCISGETYEWDFGSGFTEAGASPPHTFTSLNTLNVVTLRVSHPDFVLPAIDTVHIRTTEPPLSAGMCASGCKEMDSSGGVTLSYSCGSLTPPSDPRDIKLKVLPDNIYGATLSYAWKKRNVGSPTWTDTGTNSDTLPAIAVRPTMTSFEVKCVVTAVDVDGGTRTVDSQIITVTIN